MRNNYTSLRNFLWIAFLYLFFGIPGNKLNAQLSYKVLFLGNSYTGTNNLPQLVHDIALSAGDTLVFDSYSPGGYQLIDHAGDPTSQNKIMAGGWDYVVIQGQSQEPIIFTGQFNSGGQALYNLIKQHNPCAVTMPYMTWGRKNGDAINCASFPVMCTYQGMDTTLRNRYLNLTSSLNGEVSPVSVVWSYLRQHHPNIELYQGDESHPSLAGSYAAACSFYASIFKKDPTSVTFNSSLSPSDASAIRNAAKIQVFDQLQVWDYKRLPVSVFSYQVGSGANEILFQSFSQGVRQTYFWDFGDGFTSNAAAPVHSYASDGTYIISLTTTTCDLQGLHTSASDTVIQFCGHTPTIYSSNSWLCNYDTLWTQPADAYQWFVSGAPIPETGQYVADYARYGISGFSVVATLNGCSELSLASAQTPLSTGYYFDILGDPCAGDTVAFAVLHVNGSLTGNETILWYKDNVLLTAMNGEDTLLITTSGVYECKVSDPNATCPMDTTSYQIEYDCEVTGVEEDSPAQFWTVFPNPATETINIRFIQPGNPELIHVYDATGRMVMSVKYISEITTLSIADLPSGLYYIRADSNKWRALKFIRL